MQTQKIGCALAIAVGAIGFAGCDSNSKPIAPAATNATAANAADSNAAAPPAWNPYALFLQYKYLAAIDENADGTITVEEIDSCPDRLRKLDANSDGKLESIEFLKEDMSKAMVLQFGSYKALDSDKDGELSSDEIAAAAEVLKKLDANQNGKLEPVEYAMDSPRTMGGGGGGGGGRQQPSPEDFVKQNDKDKDGKVAKSEMTGPAANFFDRMDSDKDGFVTVEEVKAARERRAQSSGAPAGIDAGDAAKKTETPESESPKSETPKE
jgi:Ca2+-binding EF-hand superfamily protein